MRMFVLCENKGGKPHHQHILAIKSPFLGSHLLRDDMILKVEYDSQKHLDKLIMLIQIQICPWIRLSSEITFKAHL